MKATPPDPSEPVSRRRRLSRSVRLAARSANGALVEAALPDPRPPSLGLLLLETRAPLERASLRYAGGLLKLAPRGDGHAVLVVPGFAGDAPSMSPLRTFLNQQGFVASDWGLGRNRGLVAGLMDRIVERLRELHATTGVPVSLVGYSLGGVFAREAAKCAPEAVRCVVSLASPFAGTPTANHAWQFYEMACGHRVDTIDAATRLALTRPPPVPTSSIFSRSDGVVHWRCCVQPPEPGTENIEVVSSHLGLRHNPLVLYAVADRLAQTKETWRPFGAPRGLRLLYPDPNRR